MESYADSTQRAVESARPPVIIAIDLGTTSSGYVYRFSKPKNKAEKTVYRTLLEKQFSSIILFSPNQKVRAFGNKALELYYNLDEKERSEHYFFENFKMELHTKPILSNEDLIKAASGRQMPALKVISEGLRLIKNDVIEHFSRSFLQEFDERLCQWVLTVPAIWSQSAKHFMREAAYQAGLASSQEQYRLAIALEPEVAALYCQKLYISESSDETDFSLKPGSRYVVADCGGGTTDICVHELAADSGINELYKATGAANGGLKIDEEFDHLLKEIFGTDVMDNYKKKVTIGWHEFLNNFRSDVKHSRLEAGIGPSAYCKVPASFITYLRNHYNREPEDVLKRIAHGEEMFKWTRNECIGLKLDVIEKLFKRVTKEIVCLIKNVIENVGAVQFVFLVGGLAESTFLRQSVKDLSYSSPKFRVITPPDPKIAVLKGAAMYGCNPTIIRVRKSRFTYGTQTWTKFNRRKHLGKEPVFLEGRQQPFCSIFKVFVRSNESIPIHKTIDHTFFPVYPRQAKMTFVILQSEKTHVLYPDEPEVKVVEKFCFDLRDCEGSGFDRGITCSMQFGTSEIIVTTKYSDTGVETSKITPSFSSKFCEDS